jgi:DnaJ-class molecular chaperone
MGTDFYDLLGVRPDADAGTLKRAYRAKAKQYHPDTVAGQDGQLFRAIQEAYETLGDPARRRRYDLQSGGRKAFGTRQRGFPTGRATSPCLAPSPPSYLAAMLAEALAGGAPGGQWELWLSPDEARRGGRVEMVIPLPVACRHCGGGQWPAVSGCRACGGRGVRAMSHTVVLEIPPGIAPGSRVHIPGPQAGRSRQGVALIFRVDVWGS